MRMSSPAVIEMPWRPLRSKLESRIVTFLDQSRLTETDVDEISIDVRNSDPLEQRVLRAGKVEAVLRLAIGAIGRVAEAGIRICAVNHDVANRDAVAVTNPPMTPITIRFCRREELGTIALRT